jgi:hypothetical protein
MAAKSAASGPRLANPPTPERRRFSLSGPSRPLDLTHNAARRDLADIRLAGRWFAPHYAVAQTCTCTTDTCLLAAPNGDVLGELAGGDRFAVLEVSGEWAWGYSETDGRVAYVRLAAIAPI